mmetsp:Transcript_2907/g.4179  ORF Transcript_2907/g.4179 Transcript_2907/m.4179 type:complete len:216 (+) Transcript_2907:225-872(+)
MKLYYFGLMARGLQPALALEFSGLEWEGESLNGESFKQFKQTDSCKFGQVPVLLDDGLEIAQSFAIANYIGRKANMLGESEKDKVINDMLLAETEDLMILMNKSFPTIFVNLGERGKGDLANYQRTCAEIIPKHLACLEKLMDSSGKKFTSNGKTVGEAFLLGALHQIKLVVPDVLAKTPKLQAFYDGAMQHPCVKKVLSGESALGPLAQYYLPA